MLNRIRGCSVNALGMRGAYPLRLVLPAALSVGDGVLEFTIVGPDPKLFQGRTSSEKL